MNISARNSRALVAATAAALSCSLVVADAAAQPSDSRLRGDYAVTGTKSCLTAEQQGGFNSKQQPNVPSLSFVLPRETLKNNRDCVAYVG